MPLSNRFVARQKSTVWAGLFVTAAVGRQATPSAGAIDLPPPAILALVASDADDLPYPTITPYLFYAAPAAAAEWLASAFGFVERRRLTAPDGTPAHVEMATGENGVIMFGSAGHEYESPSLRRRVPASLYVRVDDPDAHADRARLQGARIVTEPVDRPWGDREYAVEDLEGHLWVFWSRGRSREPAIG